MIEDTEFKPDWVSPPGDSIREILELFDKDEDDLAKAMNKDPVFVFNMLLGRAPISEDDAKAIISAIDEFTRDSPAETTHGSMDYKFWMRREQQFREGVARLGKEAEYTPLPPCPGPVEVVEYALVCQTCKEDDWTCDDDLPFKARHHNSELACWKNDKGVCVVKAHEGLDCKKPLSEG